MVSQIRRRLCVGSDECWDSKFLGGDLSNRRRRMLPVSTVITGVSFWDAYGSQAFTL